MVVMVIMITDTSVMGLEFALVYIPIFYLYLFWISQVLSAGFCIDNDLFPIQFL